MLIMTMITVKETKLNDRSSYHMRILQKRNVQDAKSTWLDVNDSRHILFAGKSLWSRNKVVRSLHQMRATGRFFAETRSIFARLMESNKTRKEMNVN